jgi:CHAT domain-containing protein
LNGQNSFAFVLTPHTIKTFPLGEVEQDIEEFREAVQKRHPRILEFSQQLYRRLIAPFELELKTGNLLLIPYGSLHYLSFAALHDEKAYLVDRFGLRTLPSASVLEYIPAPRSTLANAPMLIFGNPNQGEKSSLPNAEAEAKTIARNMPKSRLLLGQAASETTFVEEAVNYPQIHVASHGEFQSNDPLASALLLAADEKNDGRLTVAELYAVKLDADLVTLSACETGIGELAKGDDMVGLVRGLLFAGTSSIIGSFWKVEDQATSYLMERFYAQLAHSGKREALRIAQLETKKRFSHPFFWAAFYLIGSER